MVTPAQVLGMQIGFAILIVSVAAAFIIVGTKDDWED